MTKEGKITEQISRRTFLRAGGTVIVGSAFAMGYEQEVETEDTNPEIKRYRTLGRTGFKVSDISFGCNKNSDPNIFRYAYDRGINYFDTAEGYINGESERALGNALKHMDRKKVFITTKLHLRKEASEESLLERFRKCQERLQTEYIDAFFIHGVNDISLLDHQGFHAVVKRMKSEGKLRFCGLSSHGPRNKKNDSMEKVLTTAAEDGKFDLMLLVYNFMNEDAGNKILSACKKNNVGTTAMKTSPGVLRYESFDPDNLSKEQEKYLRQMQRRGLSEQSALNRLKKYSDEQQKIQEEAKPFVEEHGIKTAEQLRKTSIKWVLQNPDMHTACISIVNFDLIDQIVPLSGKKLSQADLDFLSGYARLYHQHYCRHACNICNEHCSHKLPVSTIMRYAYYFQLQGREKEAMEKYANLGKANAQQCLVCDAPCINACPYKLNIQHNLLTAHNLLTWS